ncbi:hypothetical protein NECAME_03825 [Necator americanus]|uniref:Uncharacterized protein n=1 Tax=Necator americanus TaxID=51031 RepID=W2T294_NECAM|nr:hypothetical protein NECAME_03825 [Necator americanus]ETN75102.1 hypothetical protein NECAME_03825 [Necator americanus]
MVGLFECTNRYNFPWTCHHLLTLFSVPVPFIDKFRQSPNTRSWQTSPTGDWRLDYYESIQKTTTTTSR